MKITTSVLLSVLFCASTVSAATSNPKEEKEVMATLEAMARATMNKDVPALSKILHDDLIFSHSGGRIQDKAWVLRDVGGKQYVESYKFSDTTIRIYGNTAIVHGIDEFMEGLKGELQPFKRRMLYVLLKGPQGWQVVVRKAGLAKNAPNTPSSHGIDAP
jgi:ketosteroid isomerase-like protein